MTRLQFWILTITCSVGVFLHFTQIIVGQYAQSAQNRAADIQKILSVGQQDYARLLQEAKGILRASQQDSSLRDILVRNDIKFQNPPAPPSTPASPSGTTPRSANTSDL